MCAKIPFPSPSPSPRSYHYMSIAIEPPCRIKRKNLPMWTKAKYIIVIIIQIGTEVIAHHYHYISRWCVL